MANSLDSASQKYGLEPGTLVHVGEVQDVRTRISYIDYAESGFEEGSVQSIDELLYFKEKDSVTWVIIEGLHDPEIIGAVGTHFGIHPLVLEDILNTQQRPKVEEFDDYLFIVAKSLEFIQETISADSEQISILLLDGFVFTFKERQDHLFDPVRQRITTRKGRFLKHGSDYLTYILLDTIVDRYFVFEDALDDVIETVEDDLLANSSTEILPTIQKLKREMIFVKRNASPLRESLATIIRSESDLIEESTKVYFRDVYDHVIRVTESMESYRDLISGMLDIYLSSVSNKTNEIMRVLTVFASIFIPLTFVAGIYGMNFEYMPELQWKWSYPILMAGFVGATAGLLLYFKRKKWL